MEKQSNTLLYVFAACIAIIITIVVAVRQLSPDEAWANARSSTQDATPSKSTYTLPQAPKSKQNLNADLAEERVQTVSITLNGKRGVMVRYEVDAIVEPLQRGVAKELLNEIRTDAERAGLEAVVIVAVAAKADDDLAEDQQEHVIAFERIDGVWVQVEEPVFGQQPGTTINEHESPLIITH